MFGCDEPDALRDELGRLRASSAAREEDLLARLDRLTHALGDLFLLTEGGTGAFDWEDTQTEYYARGFEAELMEQAKRSRSACAAACEVVKKELSRLGLDPRQVGSLARKARQADEKLARAAALRAEAARLESEVKR